MNIRYKIMQFMQGRYGIDTTFYVLFSLGAVLAIVNTFLRLFVIQLIVYAIIILAFLRAFSRNIEARRKENNIVSGFVFKISKYFKTAKERRADTSHIYKKCPHCKAVLRLPRKKGKHKTICPKCKNEFSVFVFKG